MFPPWASLCWGGLLYMVAFGARYKVYGEHDYRTLTEDDLRPKINTERIKERAERLHRDLENPGE